MKTIAIIEMVKNNRPVEDDYVEIKRHVHDPFKIAQRIGGHANAARGEEILWIIGLDEHTGEIYDTNLGELTVFIAAINKYFDDITPKINILNIVYEGKSVIALNIETNRSPYVVKIQPEDKYLPEFYLPWRQGTGHRAAKREDMFKVFLEESFRPELEKMADGGYLNYTNNTKQSKVFIHGRLYYYVTPKNETFIPYHRSNVEIRITRDRELVYSYTCQLSRIQIPLQRQGARVTNNASVGDYQAIVHLPGMLEFCIDERIIEGALLEFKENDLRGTELRIKMDLGLVYTEKRITEELEMHLTKLNREEHLVKAQWNN